MPINTFKPIEFTLSLDHIRNTVVGVDAEHYFNLFIDSQNSSFLPLGGFPPGFELKILNDLKQFQAYGIKPVFVFPGLKNSVQFQYISQQSLPYEEHLKLVWKDQTPNKRLSLKHSLNPYLFRSIMDQFLSILNENDMEFLISPYSQFHQLYYMYKQGVINAIYSSNECLLFQNLENFITRFDFTNSNDPKFNYIENFKFLSNIHLNFTTFRDIAMCLGNSLQPFKLVDDNFQSLAYSQHFNPIQVLERSAKLDTFINGCSILEYCPVLKINGKVEPIHYEPTQKETLLNNPVGSPTVLKADSQANNDQNNNTNNNRENQKAEIPNGLISLFSGHLSDEFYFYQSVGLTSFTIIEAILNELYIERLPLDMQTDPIYDKIIFSHGSLKLKEYIIGSLIKKFNRYFFSKKINMKVFYNNGKLHEIDYKSIDLLNSNPLIVRHSTAKSFDLNSIILNLNNDFLDECTFSFKSIPIISSSHEIISTSLLQTLQIYKFIENGTNKLTKWGECFAEIISRNAENFESILLFLIFFQRLNDINIQTLASLDDNLPSSDKYNQTTLNLISKFAILFKDPSNPIINSKVHEYTGPVSRSLLHFDSSLLKLHSEIRDYLNVNVMMILFNGQCDVDKFTRSNETWCQLSTEIPFKSSFNSILPGLIIEETVKTFISYVNSTDNETKFVAKLEQNLKIFENYTSLNVVTLSLEILKFVSKLSSFFEIIGTYDLVDKKLIEEFKIINSTTDDIIALY